MTKSIQVCKFKQLINRGLLVLIGMSFDFSTAAQAPRLIFFTDKQNNPYSLNNPSAFLSQASINRRTAQNIRFGIHDLPVTPAYADSIKAKGARVLYTSRWLNAAVIEASDSSFSLVSSLPFVASSKNLSRASKMPKPLFNPYGNQQDNLCRVSSTPFIFGQAYDQLVQLGMDTAYARGYTGSGKTIAVLDAGFPRLNMIAAMAHIYQNNRVLQTYDFVNNDPNVYGANWHGTAVTGCIAAKSLGNAIGTAPDANYAFYRTEDAITEKEVECAYWVIGAERADSLGANVINSSLAYFWFDNSSFDYTFADLNGRNTFISRAATIAARVGMIVVNSAGNEGGNTLWRGKMAAPADADSIIAAGAVDDAGELTGFSSIGPASDGRIKPDLCARGAGTTTFDQFGSLTNYNGTSFSAPLLAGMAASLWQALPSSNNMQIISLLKASASKALSPDTLQGWGIPNFAKALRLGHTIQSVNNKAQPAIFPTITYHTNFKLIVPTELLGKRINLLIYSTQGKKIEEMSIVPNEAINDIFFSSRDLRNGIFMVAMEVEGKRSTTKIVVQ